MLKLKDSFSLAAIKIVAYSINAMNMKNRETKAKTDIPVIDSESGRIFCMSTRLRVSERRLFSVFNILSDNKHVISKLVKITKSYFQSKFSMSRNNLNLIGEHAIF